MKTIYKLLVAVLILAAPITACDTDALQDLNINPQAFDVIDPNFLFTSAQLSTAGGGASGDNRVMDWRMNIGWYAHMMQALAYTQGSGIGPGDKYINNNDDQSWDILWTDIGSKLDDVIKQTGEGGFAEGKFKNLRQAARIMQVFNFHRLTDYYGDIPYTEAYRIDEGIISPIYDTQQTVYMGMLSELESAIAALDVSADDEGFSSSDLFYAGDIAKWQRFGNSLMLRLAMRISNVDAPTAAQYVNTAISGGVMQDNGDNIWVEMHAGPSQWTNQNGISRAFIAADGGQPSFLSQNLVDRLKGSGDPRLMIFSGGTNGDMDPANQEGLPNGLDAATVRDYLGLDPSDPVIESEHFAIINPLMLDVDEPYMIMNYAETAFLIAEAHERGIGTNLPGTAQSNYEAGVRAAMQMLTPYDASFTVSDAEVDAYLVNNPYTAGAAGLEMIGDQLWTSLWFNWYEAWSSWRRSGYPNLTPVNYNGQLGNNDTNGTIPVKMIVPIQAQANPNFAGADGVGATTPNLLTTPVWWDVN